MASAASAAAAPDRVTLAAFAGVVVLGGLNSIAVHAVVQDLAPLWSASLRFLPAALIMAAIAIAARRSFPRGRSLIGAAGYGLIGFSLAFAFASIGLQEVPPGTGAVLIALTPLFTFALAIVHGQERFQLQGLIGALIAVAGVGVVFADRVSADVPAASLLLIVAAAVCIAESSIVLKWTPRSDPFWTNAVAMFAGGATLLVASLVAGEPLALPALAPTWVALGYLILLGSVLMFSLYVFALRRWTASAMSYITLLMPLVAVSLAPLLSGEQLSLSFVLGGAVILLGVYVGAFFKLRPRRSSASSAPECLPVDACAPSTSASRA